MNDPNFTSLLTENEMVYGTHKQASIHHLMPAVCMSMQYHVTFDELVYAEVTIAFHSAVRKVEPDLNRPTFQH